MKNHKSNYEEPIFGETTTSWPCIEHQICEHKGPLKENTAADKITVQVSALVDGKLNYEQYTIIRGLIEVQVKAVIKTFENRLRNRIRYNIKNQNL